MFDLFQFIAKTRMISRILFILWLGIVLAAGLAAAPAFALLLLLPAWLIEYNCNPTLKRNAKKKKRRKQKSVELVVGGSEEKRESIPARGVALDRFFKEMARFEKVDGTPCSCVPFQQYYPTYASMDLQQRGWYFYWRGQVRRENYLATELSYVFVYVYELLSGYGWKEASDGYQKLLDLLEHYGKAYPVLEKHLLLWTYHFSQANGVEYTLWERIIPEQRDSVIQNHFLALKSKNHPLKLPFSAICSLSDYSLMGSKFYRDGNAEVITEAIPRVIALVDAVLVKKTGVGLLETYGPKRNSVQTYSLYPNANCLRSGEQAVFSGKAYSTNAKLRGFLTELVRYSENVLRELYESRGRLRGIVLDEEIASVVKAFLKKEYSRTKTEAESDPRRKELELDFDDIRRLREESDAVREALRVEEESKQQETLSQLSEIKEIFAALPGYCRALLDELQKSAWEMPYAPSVQVSIEKINSLSQQYLASSLLVTEGDQLILEDDYRDEFDYIYGNLSQFAPLEEKEEDDGSSLFDCTKLSEELGQFLDALSPHQEEILTVLLKKENVSEKLAAIADAHLSMPEILLDEINEIATQLIGDILIDTFGEEICVLEQYSLELTNAMKQEKK